MPIEISIKPGMTSKETKVVYTGDEQQWAKPESIGAFGFSWPQLQGLVRQFCEMMGEGLTPVSNNLYHDNWTVGNNNAWKYIGEYIGENNLPNPKLQKLAPADSIPALQSTLKPVGASISDLSLKPSIIFKEVFDNRANDTPMTARPQISEEITETVESNWQSSQSLGVSTTIGVEVGSEAAGVKAKVESTISYEASWGHGGSKSKSTMVGDGVEIDVEVEPGKMAVAALTAQRGILTVEIDYEATLEGFMGFNFWRKGHHHNFAGKPWAYLDFAIPAWFVNHEHMKPTVKNAQKVTFDYFADGIAAVYPLTSDDPDSVDEAIYDGLNKKSWLDVQYGVTGFRTFDGLLLSNRDEPEA